MHQDGHWSQATSGWTNKSLAAWHAQNGITNGIVVSTMSKMLPTHWQSLNPPRSGWLEGELIRLSFGISNRIDLLLPTQTRTEWIKRGNSFARTTRSQTASCVLLASDFFWDGVQILGALLLGSLWGTRPHALYKDLWKELPTTGNVTGHQKSKHKHAVDFRHLTPSLNALNTKGRCWKSCPGQTSILWNSKEGQPKNRVTVVQP